MNAKTISMDRNEAREKAAAYRSQLKRRKDAEYEAAAEAYELLAKGKTLIDVGIAIREGGFDAKMRPKLALSRADRMQVRFTWEPHDDIGRFDSNLNAGGWGRKRPQFVEAVNFNRRHNVVYGPNNWGKRVEGFALVPMVPADVRPNVRMVDCHILWEVEEWSDTQIGPKPPVDPYLLKRVRGDLFVILAEWNLTELERLVMSGRAKVQ